MTVRDELAFAEDSFHSKAHAAMVRLLLKLGLIDANHAQAKFFQSDDFPISYYAKANCFRELEAIRRVAQELRIDAHEVTRENEKAIFHLFDNVPTSNIDASTWKKFRAMPVQVTDSAVTVSFANPLDFDAKSSLEFSLQRHVKVAIGQERQIMKMIESKLNGREGLDFGNLLQGNAPLSIKNSSDGQFSVNASSLESNITTEDIAAPAVIKLVNRILVSAVQQNASDLHISPESNHLAVRIRIDGITRQIFEVPAELRNPVISRLKVLCGMDIAEKRLPQDGRLRLKTAQGLRDLRVSTVPTAHGEDFVARILSPELRDVSFESLGMESAVRDRFTRALAGSSKVHLCVGPTGSGKTSTLYAAVMHLRDGTSRIITVEDPIEYRLEGISQIQVNSKIEMTFATALRSILRQDPDVVLVGEIRDAETASTAMQVAQTGHLVLSTLHTNSAAATITRLKDLGVPAFLVASSVGSIMAQRLVRRLCPSCCVPIQGTALQRCQELGLSPEGLFSPSGCDECMGLGYKGRIGVYSFLEVSTDVVEAIRREASEEEIEEIARKRGFQTLFEAAEALAYTGATSIEEIERVLGKFDSPGASHQSVRSPETDIAPVIMRTDDLAPEQSQIPRRKVLLVDDDDNIRSIFHSLLEFEMFDVVEAANGLEALKLIHEKKPDVIVCDLMMPELNGLQMVEKMRQDSRTRDIPVLMLTAIATEENELKLMQSGADDFVSKTARSDIIVARINRLMNR